MSGGGEVLGAGLDAGGIGAALGVPLNVVSAGGLVAGAGLAAGGLTDMAHEVDGDFVSAMAKKGGRGTVEKYNRRGRHLGEYDPNTGTKTKPPVTGRRTVT